MRNRLKPILANAAVLLAITGLSGVFVQARNQESPDTIHNFSSGQVDLSEADLVSNDIVIEDVNNTGIVDIQSNDADVDGDREIVVASLNNRDQTIDVDNKTIELDGNDLLIEPKEPTYIDAIVPVNSALLPTIRT